ncbi:hypothetical protein TKK_0019081 [Trichogramma kaykai]
MVPENIQEIIIKTLTDNDDYKYIYDKNYWDNACSNKSSFLAFVKRRINEDLHINVSESEVNKYWTDMRSNFVKLNKKVSEYKKLNEAQTEYYKKLIFLEDYISHKNMKVVKLKVPEENGNENVEEARAILLPDTSDDSLDQFPNIADHLFCTLDVEDVESEEVHYSDVEEVVVTAQDTSSITQIEEVQVSYASDTEELEILEGYEQVVLASIHLDNDGTVELSSTLPKDNEASTDMDFNNVNSKQQCSNERLLQQCLSVLYSAVSKLDVKYQSSAVDCIVETINKFLSQF